MMDDLIDIFRKTDLESHEEARAFDRITDLLKFIKNCKPNSERYFAWKKHDHSGCCKINLNIKPDPDAGRPRDNIFDRIQIKLKEYRQQIRAVPEGKKMEFMQFYDIHSNLKRLADLVEFTIIKHKFNCKFNEFVEQGDDIYKTITKLEKELETVIEPEVEQQVEEKEEAVAKEEVEKEKEREEEVKMEVKAPLLLQLLLKGK